MGVCWEALPGFLASNPYLVLGEVEKRYFHTVASGGCRED